MKITEYAGVGIAALVGAGLALLISSTALNQDTHTQINNLEVQMANLTASWAELEDRITAWAPPDDGAVEEISLTDATRHRQYYETWVAPTSQDDLKAYNINENVRDAIKRTKLADISGQVGYRTYFGLTERFDGATGSMGAPGDPAAKNYMIMIVYPINSAGEDIVSSTSEFWSADISGLIYSRPCPDYCD